MMDIVERLRSQINWLDGTQIVIDMCQEAADIIESLRQQLTECQLKANTERAVSDEAIGALKMQLYICQQERDAHKDRAIRRVEDIKLLIERHEQQLEATKLDAERYQEQLEDLRRDAGDYKHEYELNCKAAHLLRDVEYLGDFTVGIEVLLKERDRLSNLCDEWNSDLDGYREENGRLCDELAEFREALQEFDDLIQYQYTGSREAMSALQELSFKVRDLLGEPTC